MAKLSIAFIDESGFMSARRTWALQGCTPELKNWGSARSLYGDWSSGIESPDWRLGLSNGHRMTAKNSRMGRKTRFNAEHATR